MWRSSDGRSGDQLQSCGCKSILMSRSATQQNVLLKTGFVGSNGSHVLRRAEGHSDMQFSDFSARPVPAGAWGLGARLSSATEEGLPSLVKQILRVGQDGNATLSFSIGLGKATTTSRLLLSCYVHMLCVLMQ